MVNVLWFESISGLRINLGKSELIAVGKVPNADNLANRLGCKSGNLPSTYLGLPLGGKYNSKSIFDGIEEKMQRKLPLWKRSYILKEGG